MTFTDCRFCQQSHVPLLMCPPAKRVLDALLEAGQRFDMPTVEFPDPVQDAVGVFGGETIAVAQLAPRAGMVEVAGTFIPVLVLTGQDADRRPLPEWMFAAEPPAMRKAVNLVREMGDMAIRRARTANQAQGRI